MQGEAVCEMEDYLKSSMNVMEVCCLWTEQVLSEHPEARARALVLFGDYLAGGLLGIPQRQSQGRGQMTGGGGGEETQCTGSMVRDV